MTQETKKYYRYYTYIKPITKNPIVKTYGSTIFTLLSMVVFIFFAIKPTVETIAVLQKKINNAKITLDKANKKAAALSLAKDNYQKIDDSIKAKIETILPSTLEAKSLITVLEQISKRHEATISALQIQPLVITPRQKDAVGIVGEINFTFNIEGLYKNIVSLLQDLKSSARAVSIDRISVTKSSSGGDLLVSMNGKAYYLK